VKIYAKDPRTPGRLGVLAGSFNPPTTAHMQLIEAALGSQVDEVLCVLPRAFPHKEYFGATLEQRLELLQLASIDGLPYSVATSEAGLFLDIARECREHYGGVELSFICGRDAAERVLSWDYGRPGTVEQMLSEFELLVAARQGDFEPPALHRDRIRKLYVRGGYDAVSSTEVRERIARGQPWEHLVPEAIADRVRAIYS
jgi:nicotinate-nucleotide adenylyltransferase